MKRRDAVLFTTTSAASALLPAYAAISPPLEGRHYARLPTPLPTASRDRVEIVEFFWYGCPHCQAFDPLLERWVHAHGPAVNLRRVHVSGRAQVAAHQRLFFALESLGIEPKLRPAVFDLIAGQHRPMLSAEEQASALAAYGLPASQLEAACKSFAVAAKCQQAQQLQRRYDADTVPMLFVDGRYRTSPAMASGEERMSDEAAGMRALQVMDYLLRERLG